MKTLLYEFKCTDADDDGIFYDTPFGEIDSTEFAQFIDDIEQYTISLKELKTRYSLNNDIKSIIHEAESEWLEIYDPSNDPDSQFGNYVVLFDGDIHYIYSIH